MNNTFFAKNAIKSFNSTLKIEGDKSLSIRWALLASQATGKSYAKNILVSEDVLNTLKCLKKLGVKIKLNKNKCEIKGLGINGFKYKKKITLNAGNSGTLARLILGLLTHSKSDVKIIGDKSLRSGILTSKKGLISNQSSPIVDPSFLSQLTTAHNGYLTFAVEYLFVLQLPFYIAYQVFYLMVWKSLM